MNLSKPLPAEDLQHVLTHARPCFLAMKGANLLLTGGTGFFGRWLIESLLHADRELALDLRITLLTRDAASFSKRAPHIAEHPAIRMLQGDVSSFTLPQEHYTHVVHAATDSTGAQQALSDFALSESIVDGTRCLLKQLDRSLPTRLLYVSTGAVYGRSTEVPFTPEEYPGGPNPLLASSAYEEAKRMAENLCITYTEDSQITPVIARCFAFVGPLLPLDAHFAIGNFIGSAMRKSPIQIQGDGTPRRSWLYMADLAIWLWTMLEKGAAGRAYNVGSDEAYTIAAAAQLTAKTLSPKLEIQIARRANPVAPLNSYVPLIERARRELGVDVTVDLAEALRRTAAWHLA